MLARRVFMGGGLSFGLAHYAWAQGAPHSAVALPSIASRIAERAQPGDVIFMASRSALSNVIRWGDLDSNFSHVGLLDTDEFGVEVYHAAPNAGGGAIQSQRLESFLSDHGLHSAAIFRLEPSVASAAQTALREGRNMMRRALRYDDDLSYDEHGPVFCTEFVWRAYRSAGVDLISPKSRVDGPLQWRRAFPSQLLQSGLLHPVGIDL